MDSPEKKLQEGRGWGGQDWDQKTKLLGSRIRIRNCTTPLDQLPLTLFLHVCTHFLYDRGDKVNKCWDFTFSILFAFKLVLFSCRQPSSHRTAIMKPVRATQIISLTFTARQPHIQINCQNHFSTCQRALYYC